jgi:hypothetical protein
MNNEEQKNFEFIQINENTIINLHYVQWAKKIEDCMYVCNKVYGCDETTLYGTHKICKSGDYSKSYELLHTKFIDK